MDRKEEFLNEEKFQKTDKKVKTASKGILILGGLLLVIGIVMLFMGIIGFGSVFISGIESAENDAINNSSIAKEVIKNFGLFALGGFVTTMGSSIFFSGGIFSLLAHRREISAYTTQQKMPIVQEKIEKMTPTVAAAAEEISKSISKGIKEGTSENNNIENNKK